MLTIEALKSTSAIFDFSNRGKIEVSGTEAAVFLHNLATNDIKNLPIGHGCETFFCNATARVLAHGWIWRLAPQGKRDTFWLDLDPGLSEKLYQHLDRHLISEDVTLTDQTSHFVQYHVVGPRANELAGDLPPWTCRYEGGLTIRHVQPLGIVAVDLLGPITEAESLLQAMQLPPASDLETFHVLRVEAGLPCFGPDMDETTFVAEIHRTEQAISYKKGCYLGQEPIVMARDRGVVQRALVGLRLDEPVPSRSLLFREGKEIGRTASCVRSPRWGAIALAYVKRGSQTPGTVVEVEVQGQRRPATVSALPFTEG